MATDRFVVIGVATARAEWFRAMGQWASSAALPIEFIRCISVAETRARLESGRPHSVLVVDERIAGLDRDLLDKASEYSCAVVVITSDTSERPWLDLGAARVISESSFDRATILATITEIADPIADVSPERVADLRVTALTQWSGELVAVTGQPGAGASTVAMAIAQGLGSDPRQQRLVCLADLALDADMAMLHDARDVTPGLQELLELHRGSVPSRSQVQRGLFQVEVRNYDLLLGLRNHRDWTILRRRSTEATLEGLTRAYRTVVADVDLDCEGERETGSIDVEDRNLLARTTLRRASAVVVVGSGSMKGLFSLTRSLQRLVDFEIAPNRLLPIINHAPRSVRRRAELVTAFSDIVPDEISEQTGSPLLVSTKTAIIDAIRDVAPLPRALVRPLTAAVAARLANQTNQQAAGVDSEPKRVAVGSLGSFAEETLS
ncbi:MAG: hypothetical protein V3V01_16480 [Acidimicrobiales bacterium]